VVSWKTGVVLLAILLGLGVFAVVSRPQPAPAKPSFVPCGVLNAVYFRVQAAGRTVELQRSAPDVPWNLVQPAGAVPDPNKVAILVNSLDVIRVQNTIPTPGPAAGYGLDPPRDLVTCRDKQGSSYTLSVGSQSFDGSGYYARKGGDNRVYVISSVEVDQFDQALAEPPVMPTPSPSQ
jgi:Domain of unknown function (DUF4340)